MVVGSKSFAKRIPWKKDYISNFFGITDVDH